MHAKKALFLAFIALLLVSCTTLKGKYSDVEDVLRKMIRAYEVLIRDIDMVEKKDKKTAEVIRAIDKFINAMSALDAEGKRLEAKYPELKNDDNVPGELKELQKKFVDVATCEETKRTSIIILSYVYDPAVKEAADRLSIFLDGQ